MNDMDCYRCRCGQFVAPEDLDSHEDSWCPAAAQEQFEIVMNLHERDV